MNKTVLCILLTAVSVFAQGPRPFARPGGPMGGGRGGPFGAERVVTGAPYSAVEVRQYEEKLGDGNVINRTSQTTIYRDSQGRTRTEVTVTPDAGTGKQPYTMITISDPVAGLRHVLDSSTMTSHTNRIPTLSATSGRGGPGNVQKRNGQIRNAAPPNAPSAASRPARGGAAITKAELGTQLKNGVIATGARETEVIPAGRIGNAQAITVVRESWYSTELKRSVSTSVVDPHRGNSTTELTHLVPGEPSAALFAVPSGYKDKTAGRGGRGAFSRGGRAGGAGTPQ